MGHHELANAGAPLIRTHMDAFQFHPRPALKRKTFEKMDLVGADHLACRIQRDIDVHFGSRQHGLERRSILLKTAELLALPDAGRPGIDDGNNIGQVAMGGFFNFDHGYRWRLAKRPAALVPRFPCPAN
jgi:hypothetical protein